MNDKENHLLDQLGIFLLLLLLLCFGNNGVMGMSANDDKWLNWELGDSEVTIILFQYLKIIHKSQSVDLMGRR